jgi:RNA polymerase sigma-70 factor (ECF subfamily)
VRSEQRLEIAQTERGKFGDPRAAAAVEAAMEAHDRRLRRYFAQLLGVDGADDAVQELYARLLHVARNGGPDAFSLGYLKRAAESVVFDILRRRRTRRTRDSVELDPETPADAPTPFDHARERQRLNHLKDAILNLPPLQRRVLTMHRFEDMSLADISREMGVPLRTVQRQMMNALANCRLHLDQRGWSDQ